MVLRRATSMSRGIGRVGPGNWDFYVPETHIMTLHIAVDFFKSLKIAVVWGGGGGGGGGGFGK
jgi:hypothetical protein